MLRTCAVRFDAIELTLSVKSFQVPATPGTMACPPSLPSVPTSLATRVTSAAKERSWSTHFTFVADFAPPPFHFSGEGANLVPPLLNPFLILKNFPAHVPRDFLREIAVGHGNRHVSDITPLAGEVTRHGIHVIRQIFP